MLAWHFFQLLPRRCSFQHGDKGLFSAVLFACSGAAAPSSLSGGLSCARAIVHLSAGCCNFCSRFVCIWRANHVRGDLLVGCLPRETAVPWERPWKPGGQDSSQAGSVWCCTMCSDVGTAAGDSRSRCYALTRTRCFAHCQITYKTVHVAGSFFPSRFAAMLVPRVQT